MININGVRLDLTEISAYWRRSEPHLEDWIYVVLRSGKELKIYEDKLSLDDVLEFLDRYCLAENFSERNIAS